MKYKHIVFDIDGTLIDTEYAVLHSLQETIRALSGREIPCSELKFALGITGIDALKKLEIKDISHAIELMSQAEFIRQALIKSNLRLPDWYKSTNCCLNSSVYLRGFLFCFVSVILVLYYMTLKNLSSLS